MGSVESSVEDSAGCCVWKSKEDDGTNIDEEESFKSAFQWRSVLAHIDEEIDKVYDEFDQKHTHHIKWGETITKLIVSLKNRGFEFGTRQDMQRRPALINGVTEAKCESAQRVAPYTDAKVSRIKCQLFAELGEDFADDGLDADEFRAWIHEQIYCRKTNLRILFATNPFLGHLVKISFSKADNDKSGRVDAKELEGFMDQVRNAIEDADDEEMMQDVQEVLGATQHNPKLGLSHEEFHAAVLELLAGVYFRGFNSEKQQMTMLAP